MRRPWPILAGLEICVTLLVVSVLLAGSLDSSAPVAAPDPTAASPTAGTIKVIPDRADLPDGDAPPGFWWGTDSLSVTVTGAAPS